MERRIASMFHLSLFSVLMINNINYCIKNGLRTHSLHDLYSPVANNLNLTVFLSIKTCNRRNSASISESFISDIN